MSEVKDEIKIADLIYYSNEKSISYNKCEAIAKILVQEGYGNIKKAVEDFIEKACNEIIQNTLTSNNDEALRIGHQMGKRQCVARLESLFKELYGEEV